MCGWALISLDLLLFCGGHLKIKTVLRARGTLTGNKFHPLHVIKVLFPVQHKKYRYAPSAGKEFEGENGITFCVMCINMVLTPHHLIESYSHCLQQKKYQKIDKGKFN